MSQVKVPDWVRYKRPPQEVNYDTARASAMASGTPHWITQLPAGTKAATLPHLFFEDANGSLWMEGRSSLGHPLGDDAYVIVERVEEGVRVLSWPPGGHIYHEPRDPNQYGPEDMWVVEFPEARS